MSFQLLKEVIAFLKKTSRCPTCKAKLTDEDIFVLATTAHPEEDIYYGIFGVSCLKCNTEGCMLIEANENHPFETITATDASAISINEVLDMRNFLKQWKGDFKELFNKEEAK